jgi:hypothetical protein
MHSEDTPACGHLETNERCSKDKSEGREDGRSFAITSSNNDVREDEQRYRAHDQERLDQARDLKFSYIRFRAK